MTTQSAGSPSPRRLHPHSIIWGIYFAALFVASLWFSGSWVLAVLTTAGGLALFELVRESYRFAMKLPYRWWVVLISVFLVLLALYLMAFVVLVTADPSMGNPWGATDPVDAFWRWSRMSHNWHRIVIQAIEVLFERRAATFTNTAGVMEFIWMVRMARIASYLVILAFALHIVGWINRRRSRG